MSNVVNLQLSEDQVARLQRAAHQLGQSPSETAVVLLEEALRQRDFAHIEFRDSAAGRQAYVKGTRLAAWHVAMIARHFDDAVPQVAAHLEEPEYKIAAALSYAAVYTEEVASAIAENEAIAANIQHYLPNVRIFEVKASSV